MTNLLKSTFELTISEKKMTFKEEEFPNISRMLSLDKIPPAPFLSRAQMEKQRINNEGGGFDFKNSSAKAFFLEDQF